MKHALAPHPSAPNSARTGEGQDRELANQLAKVEQLYHKLCVGYESEAHYRDLCIEMFGVAFPNKESVRHFLRLFQKVNKSRRRNILSANGRAVGFYRSTERSAHA